MGRRATPTLRKLECCRPELNESPRSGNSPDRRRSPTPSLLLIPRSSSFPRRTMGTSNLAYGCHGFVLEPVPRSLSGTHGFEYQPRGTQRRYRRASDRRGSPTPSLLLIPRSSSFPRRTMGTSNLAYGCHGFVLEPVPRSLSGTHGFEYQPRGTQRRYRRASDRRGSPTPSLGGSRFTEQIALSIR